MATWNGVGTIAPTHARGFLITGGFMSGQAKVPFTVSIEDLTCPVCDNESAIYVREDVKHDPDERAAAMCDECGSRLTVSVELQPYFGDPKLADASAPEPTCMCGLPPSQHQNELHSFTTVAK
jgi:hypothetical protein